ncbi:hypothetical protein JTB14_034783 [Gonioctena quinquepunctata]|nr:hypothetical protein JTB14_034783 [Gonioctena quinquepunctata]
MTLHPVNVTQPLLPNPNSHLPVEDPGNPSNPARDWVTNPSGGQGRGRREWELQSQEPKINYKKLEQNELEGAFPTPRPSIPSTGDIENPFIGRPSIHRSPIRARTSSFSETRNFLKMDDTVVPEQPIKRKRNDLSPEKTKTDGIKNEGDTFKKTVESMLGQIKKLEMVVKDMYKPNQEVKEEASRRRRERMAKRKRVAQTTDVGHGRSTQKKIEKLNRATFGTQCQECEETIKKGRRQILTQKQNFGNFQSITEDDWVEEVFPKINIEQCHKWEAPSEYEIILPCNSSIDSKHKEIGIAINKFGGKEGLKRQNKSKGEVVMMVHSLSFPKEDGSFSCNARGIYYPITTDDMSNREAEDVDVFQCIEKIRNHILANQKLKVAVPEMEGIGGVMFERIIKYLFVNTNVEVRMYKPANSQKNIITETLKEANECGWSISAEKTETRCGTHKNGGKIIRRPPQNGKGNTPKNILKTTKGELLVTGDFNSHNPIWGSERLDQRGRIVEEVIDEYNLVLLNTGEGPFLNSRSNTFSHLDLSLCSPGVAHYFNWNVISEYSFTDHAAIQIQCSTRNKPPSIPGRWQIKRADWEKFRNHLEPLEMRHTVDESVEVITNSIICAADHSIPKSSGDMKSDYNKDFTLFEFRKALKETRNSSPGLGKIHYDMIKNVPPQEEQQILNLVNKIWSEGHIGIAGNELADIAARDATGQNYLNDIPLRPEDIKTHLKNRIRAKWNQEWNDSNHKLKSIKNKVDEILPFPSHQKRERVALTRLRIGHTHITSSYLLCGSRPPICDTCEVQLTVEHLLLVCPLYAQARNDCSIPDTLQRFLKNERYSLRTIQFLTETGLMRKV